MQNFGRWNPDAYSLNSGLAAEVSGVLPGLTGYKPFPQMAIASAALPAAGRGGFMARTSGNAADIFVGTAAKLEEFSSITAWDDRSKVGGYTLATDDCWQFAQYLGNVYATHIGDTLQSIDPDAGTIFADVSGPPKARYMTVVGDFLMLGNTDSNSRQVRWCGRKDGATWTTGQKDADNQIFADGGDVMGLSGFEQGGLIWQTDTVRQMLPRGDAAIFEFHREEAAQGTLAPYSIITRLGTSYYYGIDGFQQISFSGGSQAIGANWVDGWFLANSNAATRPKAIIGSADPASQRVFWLFAANGNATSSVFDHVICFDPTLTDSDFGPWTHAPLSASFIFPAATTATTLENLGSAGLGYTLETVPYSLDADIWKGGAPRMAAFDGSFKMNFFTGTPQAATLQTAEFQPLKSRSFVNGFRFVGDSADAIGRIATAERPQTDIAANWGSTNTVNDQGIIYKRASGRYMRMEVTMPAGAAWNFAAGIDLDDPGLLVPDGLR